MQAPWVIATPRVKQIAARYRVPIHIIASVRANPERIAKAYRAAHYREYYELLATTSDNIELFGRVLAFKAEKRNTADGEVARITLTYPTTKVIWDIPIEEFRRKDVEEWLRDLTEWIYCKARKVIFEKEVRGRKQKVMFWKAEKVKIAKAQVDREAAEKLIEAYRRAGLLHPALHAGAALIGYLPRYVMESPDLQLLATLYLLPIVTAEPIHVVLLSTPGIGKTTIALLYHTALRWEFYNEPPSLATLVGDARTGKSVVAGVDGLWFDEFDKWEARRSKTDQLAEIIEVMLTGMEQGLWKRSKGGEKRIEVENPIPVVFTGNVDVAADPRSLTQNIIRRAAPRAADAFNQRIAVAVTIAWDMSELVMKSTWESAVGKPVVTRPSVLRGYVELMREKYLAQPEPQVPKQFKGRFARSFKRVWKAIRVLFCEYRDSCNEDAVYKLTEMLVKGAIFDKPLAPEE